MTILLTNAALLLTEPHMHVETGDLLIQNGRIAQIGAVAPLRADKTIDCTDKLVIPGLINCHTHMYMSIFRNYADDLSFGDWLFGKILPAEDKLTPEDAYWCNLLSCIEMIKSGTTCFLDMHMFIHQCAKAARQTGMRAVLSRGLVGDDPQDEAGLHRIDEALTEAAAYQNDDLLTFMLAPHAIYTCGEDYLRHLVTVARENNLPFHLHLSETQTEFDDAMAKYGLTPTAYLEKLGLLTVPTVAAHCVYLTDEDIAILQRHNVSVATNPISNMKLGNGFAPVSRLLAAGVNVCLGTDSAASNNALNLFREMSALSYIHKGVDKNGQSLTAIEALTIATQNGANALGLADKIGSLTVGKQADLAILDLNQPAFIPRNNLAASLVYSANGSEVETVIINGQIVMEQRRITGVDEQEVYRQVERIRQAVL